MSKFTFLLFIFFGCNNVEIKDEVNPDKINAFDESSLNSFLGEFLKNDFLIDGKEIKLIDSTDYLSNRLEKQLLKKNEIDSLISDNDWKFIEMQMNENKEHKLYQTRFEPTLLNTDSLLIEREKFQEKDLRITDSIKKVDQKRGADYQHRRYIRLAEFERKFTPTYYFRRPLFSRDRKILFLSYRVTYGSWAHGHSELIAFEFSENKWQHKKTIKYYLQ